MGVLINPVVRTTQPQFPAKIDLNHPLGRRVKAFCYAVGGTMYDAANGLVATPTSQAVVTAYSTYGRAAALGGTGGSGAASYFQFPNNRNHNPTGDVTFFWRGRLASLGNFRQLASKIPSAGNGATNTPFDFYVTSGGIMTFTKSNGSASKGWVNSGGAYTAGVVQDLTYSSPSAMENTPTVWLSGASVGVSSSGSGTGAPTTNTNGLVLGRRPDGATQSVGHTELFIIFDGLFDDKDTLLLRQNVYALLSPIQRPVFVPDTAAAVTFQPGWAMNANSYHSQGASHAS